MAKRAKSREIQRCGLFTIEKPTSDGKTGLQMSLAGGKSEKCRRLIVGKQPKLRSQIKMVQACA